MREYSAPEGRLSKANVIDNIQIILPGNEIFSQDEEMIVILLSGKEIVEILSFYGFEVSYIKFLTRFT